MKDAHESFCTLSSDLRHEPPAIIAHANPIFNRVLNQKPALKFIHLLSDGPTSQYRCKKMFFLLTRFIVENYPQIESIVDNFFEIRHGKYAADGIGAVIKRTADDFVSQCKDVNNLEALKNILNKTKINVHCSQVFSNDIAEIEKYSDSNLPVFIGTMKVHQWIWNKQLLNKINFNELSCYTCDLSIPCTHYHLGSIDYEILSVKSNDTTKCNIKKTKRMTVKRKSDVEIGNNEIRNKFRKTK